MTYFKKYDPRIPLADGRGRRVEFIDLGGTWGLLETEDAYLIRALKQAQAEQRGGVVEIDREEFENLKKKENQTCFQSWRETFSLAKLKKLVASGSRSVAVDKLAGLREGFQENKTLARPQGVSDLVLKAVKR